MNLKKAIPFLIVGAIIGVIGYMIIDKSNENAAPQSFAVDIKPITCEYSFLAFEMLEQERIVSSTQEIKFGNFPTKELTFSDTVNFASFYVVPVRKYVKWKGKKVPTLAQIATVYEPYLLGGKLFKMEQFRSEGNCKRTKPEEKVEFK